MRAESFLILAVICVPKRGLSRSVGSLMTIFKTCYCKEVEIMCMKIIIFGNVCNSATLGMEYKTLLYPYSGRLSAVTYQLQYFLLKNVITLTMS